MEFSATCLTDARGSKLARRHAPWKVVRVRSEFVDVNLLP